ncbi:2-succinyl-5-enolpyruvyl-6-hydroxy-3-cyclohexene-1-carboxylic-acid synthase [Aquibacillus sp. 3ASR75-11]|uniref:2-succinyl-5-enolpyruvyl-6-hydroxy-3-cyclohexene-1-carboxylate synthase n=1 Tax=Terrihalobacillus insolitus TaxID=2950438 RepID=A0A9X3WT18_9BACI|nr:2-succinyl-5-enolpyruvyl-6-hydroxy-3-cyclohexene-1-carboxylic-acid synthase [Terrihalobacillus insolitus]MDC3412398.1 2-succinyl-5-enolpyruvyl-6-hydroxy-3-cyclohexene-1-carboxylic-acid synthase [Terrihalobacillus insolitus]MDC3422909.1 2-succinyl-5-enolpyruvyl-6-hydroxy-3-cyclohexene-1-carboxylic-acid synthase [Terrihalobacillus insolitus]
MDHTESLTRYVANFVDELFKNGLTDVVISPGSRSTPLAMTFAEHPHVTHWVNMDERSAAFFALGMAKKENRPVALVCTSGTAAANYFPGIVEAHYSRVPLLVLTADRPNELRDVGAPQAINQLNMYGNYSKWFHEMASPDGDPMMLRYVRRSAARAYTTSNMGNPGVVHLNFPFREPLIPDFSIEDLWEGERESFTPHTIGKRGLAEYQLDRFFSLLSTCQKGVIVCGPQTEQKLVEAILLLSEKWNIPVLADPLSQLRTGPYRKENVIESYDAILKSGSVRENVRPDFIIRFGAMPVSKPYLFYVKENSDVVQFVVEAEEGYREPAGNKTEFVITDPVAFCYQLLEGENPNSFSPFWLETWKKLNEIATEHILTESADTPLTEGHAVTHLMRVIPDQSTVYVGNSMPIRDVDTFMLRSEKQLFVFGNRGVNGIDGITSSALGAASHGERVTLLIGDLSFFHDMNGLLVGKQYHIPLTIVLINNNGGGIFSFLPQSEHQKHFEVLFGTPMDIELEKAVVMYGGFYQNPATWQEYEEALQKSYQTPGLSVIEINTNRSENVDWHKQKWNQIEHALLEQLQG